MHRVELKELFSDIQKVFRLRFLMHRVELKAHCLTSSLTSIAFLMHRVELKEIHSSEVGGWRVLFLMHRVELKASKLDEFSVLNHVSS